MDKNTKGEAGDRKYNNEHGHSTLENWGGRKRRMDERMVLWKAMENIFQGEDS